MIEILPQIILYIVVGYAFLKTLYLVTLHENSDNIEHVLAGSLVIGYICYQLASLIPCSYGTIIDFLGISACSVFVAYIIGLILNTRLYIKICDILKIRESGKKYLWSDILDHSYPMKVSLYYGNIKYNGYLFNCESYSNTPNVVLVSYKMISVKQGDILEDHSQDKKNIIILNTNKADKVEIIYDGNSKICNEIQSFCNIINNEQDTN